MKTMQFLLNSNGGAIREVLAMTHGELSKLVTNFFIKSLYCVVTN